MKTNLFIGMFLMFSFLKAQTVCNYVEVNPTSQGYVCEENILNFTSSINTIITGRISATDEILIIPIQNYSITIIPAPSCENCADDGGGGGGTTIKPKQGGNGGVHKNKNSDINNKVKQLQIIIEKNPVDQLLKMSLKKGLIKKIIIFDHTGKEIINKNNLNKKVEIDVSILPKGIYGVKTITDDNQTYTKQFIKN